MKCFACGRYWSHSTWAKTFDCDRCKEPIKDPNRKEQCLKCAMDGYRALQERKRRGNR